MVARELLLSGRVLLAHALTLSRIPLVVLFWLTYGDPAWSISLVALAAVTDALDGTVARWAMRRSGATRSAGEWLDPLADKVFVIGVLGAIQAHDPAPWALIALIAARELVLIPLAAAYRLVMPARMPHAFKAGVIGKAATVAELFAVAALVLRSSLALPLAIAAAGLGLAAVVSYISRSLAGPAATSFRSAS
jgi:cardiolipin synthase